MICVGCGRRRATAWRAFPDSLGNLGRYQPVCIACAADHDDLIVRLARGINAVDRAVERFRNGRAAA
jgi:hypothetical protein